MHWYLGVLKKYAVFSGRARRAEFWYFVLFSTIISIVLAILDGFMSGSIGATPEDVPWDPMGDILTNIYNLAILIPSIAVSTRRLHDVDKSGWWQLLHFVVLIGSIVLLVWMVKSGTHGPNRFGEDPKQDGEEHFGQPQ